MTLFITILIVLVAGVILARVAWGFSVPYPSLLALGGALVALIPGMPTIAFDPSLALVIFVAPVLLDAAYRTSLRDLKDNSVAITTLVLVAVGLTTFAVAVVFHAFAPQIPWAAAIALGAIVAPPDAAAASAVLRDLPITRRVLYILEGESLFNDASALLILALAISFVQGESRSIAELIPAYGLAVVGSVAAGIGMGWLYPKVFSLLSHAPATIVLQFCGTFGVWIIAEKLGLSPILTTVAYGIALARISDVHGPLVRTQSSAVWDTVVFLANVLAFALIGMQLGPLIGKMDRQQLGQYLTIAGVILAVVIVVRIGWVMLFHSAIHLKNRKFGVSLPERVPRLSAKGDFVIAWSGMRGIVTLAAALSLPPYFPERDLIQFVAFAVVLGTLLIQGFTLGALARFLDLGGDHQLELETARARRVALKAALATLERDRSPYAQALRTEYQALLDQGFRGETEAPTGHEELRLNAVSAAREAIAKLRDRGIIGDDAFRRVEELLDRTALFASRPERD